MAQAAVARAQNVSTMARQIVKLLKPEDGNVFIDMTFGQGGHSKALLDTHKSIKIIAVDRDPVAIKIAQQLAADTAIKSQKLGIDQSVIPIHSKFSNADKRIHLSGVPYDSVNGVMFDLGPSEIQYNNPSRGFSLDSDAPLDMRMDTTNETDITAEDVVNNLSQENIGKILKVFAEEKRSRKVANAIVDARTLMGRIKKTSDLTRIVAAVSSPYQEYIPLDMHPAARTFQAIRIFVNNELNELNYALEKMRKFLIPANSQEDINDTNGTSGGVATVITYNHQEDTIVKRHFTSVDVDYPVMKWLSQHDRIRTNVDLSRKDIKSVDEVKTWLPLLKHAHKPSNEDLIENPRSKTAKLRAAVRLL